VSFQIERVAADRKTGKPVADITRYTYRDGDTRYVVTFERQKTILQTVFREEMPLIKRLLAKIVGFDGAYHRFTGKVTIEKFEKDVRVEIFDDHAIWELMYFHYCPAISRTESTGWNNRVDQIGSCCSEVPVKWAFS